tara:strand:+ start:652 stop:1239 length:588 start_codon:yes stop_codon:yes gene_type:complete
VYERLKLVLEMQYVFSSVLLLTILLVIGLVFFLRAASKDRTTVVDVYSPLPPIEVLNGIINWLDERGWQRNGGDAQASLLRFNGSVSSSPLLIVFLSILGGLGASCLGLVIAQLFPSFGWWPLMLALVGAPLAGFIYHVRSSRVESLELKLLNSDEKSGSLLRVRAHRDELIAMELALSETLKISSDGSLLSSPI